MGVAAPLAIVGGLLLLAVGLLVLGGLTYGPAGLPRSLQVTSVWLVWGGTLVCFLYSCAPAFSTKCDTWDADLRAYDFGIACIDAIILAAACAMLFTLGSCDACPGLTPPRGALVQGVAAVLLVAKLAVGVFRLVEGSGERPSGGATTDAPELKVVVMGASTAVAVLSCALYVVQWVALKESIATTFMEYAASCDRYSGAEGLLEWGAVATPHAGGPLGPHLGAPSPLAGATPVPELFPELREGAPGKRHSAPARPPAPR